VFVCTVTDFSATENDSGVKFRVLARLLSGLSFSHFGDLWPRGGSPKSLKANEGSIWWDMRLADALVVCVVYLLFLNFFLVLSSYLAFKLPRVGSGAVSK